MATELDEILDFINDPKISKNERKNRLKVFEMVKYTFLNKVKIRKSLKVSDVSIETKVDTSSREYEEISVKHRMEQSEMKKYVCNGAKLECPYLNGKLKLNVFEERLIFVKHEPIATSEDCNKKNFSIDFISGTGKCSKTGNDCLKCIDAYWKKETLAPYIFLNGAQPVLKTSILKCRVDESIDIKVIESGQDFGIGQGIKNLFLNFHDENPWIVRVIDGEVNMSSGIETEILAVSAVAINPHLAVELDKDGGEDFFTGYDQKKEGLINSPLGFIYKPIYNYISDPLRKFIWGEHKEENSKKSFFKEEIQKLKKKEMETIAKSSAEENSTLAKSSTKGTGDLKKKFIIDYLKDRAVDKAVEYRRPIYDFITKNNNTLSNTTQIFIPTKKYSDNTVDFLLDSYVTVIFKNKK